jgi:hypothetical protein
MDSQTSIPNQLLEASPELRNAVEKIKSEVYRLKLSEIEAHKILKKILKIQNDKPQHWSPNSNACYYKEKFAKLLQKWLKEIEDSGGKDLLISATKLKKSRESIVSLISQAWIWLINNTPDEIEKEKLINLKHSITVKRVFNGVILHTEEEVNYETIDASETVDKQNISRNWKEEIINFCEESLDGTKLVMNGLRLDSNGIQWINNYIEVSKGIIIQKINASKLELIKHMELWNKFHGH